jgi:ACS family glucarate transporter-like MFS transporter
MLPRRFIIVLATFSLSVLLYVDRACVSTAKEPVIQALAESDPRWLDRAWADTRWGWIMAAFAFGYALFQTPSGAFADRLGARRILTTIVTLWSVFTGLTAAAWNLASMIVVRFLFGMGEAGAFPGMARVVYSWIPVKERGLVKGINFSGGRLGAAVTMPILPWLIATLGWKQSFLVLMAVGFCWALFWWFWFRDEPAEQRGLPPAELEFILHHRQQAGAANEPVRPLALRTLFGSANLWFVMGQYFCSNFTFFFCLTWLYPYVKKTYALTAVDAGFYAMAPLLAGAAGNIFSGWFVDRLYRTGRWVLSRRLPAMIGFALAALGMVMSVGQETALGAVVWLSLAVFGADMTLSPSWSLCIDIGGQHAGAVSGTMNMAGNLGSAFVGLVFPYLLIAYGPKGFFYVGAALNTLALGLWLLARPDRRLQDSS